MKSIISYTKLFYNNIEAKDLILGQSIAVDGKFASDEIQSGYAIQALTAKALKGTDYTTSFLYQY